MIMTIWHAMKKGKRLRDSATWKNRQIAVDAIVAVLGALVLAGKLFGLEIDIAPEDRETVAAAVFVLVGTFGAIFTAATSKKVGTDE